MAHTRSGYDQREGLALLFDLNEGHLSDTQRTSKCHGAWRLYGARLSRAWHRVLRAISNRRSRRSCRRTPLSGERLPFALPVLHPGSDKDRGTAAYRHLPISPAVREMCQRRRAQVDCAHCHLAWRVCAQFLTKRNVTNRRLYDKRRMIRRQSESVCNGCETDIRGLLLKHLIAN